MPSFLTVCRKYLQSCFSFSNDLNGHQYEHKVQIDNQSSAKISTYSLVTIEVLHTICTVHRRSSHYSLIFQSEGLEVTLGY